MGMWLEIDIRELAGAFRDLLEELRASSLPALLSRKDAAVYLGVSDRMLDSLPIPRVEITDRCARYRRPHAGCSSAAAYRDARG
jgi:hypothetical protein